MFAQSDILYPEALNMKFTTFCATVMSATVCALTSSTLAGGGAIAWGWNNAGQTNVPNSAYSNVTAITGGYEHTTVIKNSGVLAWGNNTYGQTNVPGAASSGVTKIAAGAYHSLALTGGSLVAWGYNAQGQCTFPTSTPNSSISAIAAGSYHSLIVRNGTVFAFGWNSYGQCNLGGTGTGSGVTSVAGGYGHSAALKASAVLAWGDNFYGQRTIPTTATFNITAIACGADHTIALNSSGNVIAWGNNSYGQCLGTNSPGSPITTTANGTAVKINGVTLTGVTAIAGGTDHTVALKNGVALAWGTNTNGQCSIPTSATSGVTAIGAGEYHTVAVGVEIIDPCDIDGNGTPNADEPGPSTTSWLFPNITSTFENPANWSAGIPGYNTTAKITGNPQIEFGCDNSVKTLELSTGSSNWYPGMSLNLNSHSLTVYGGRIAFAPGAGSYQPYSVNISGPYSNIYNGAPNDTLPLIFESDHATWNINYTSIYSNRIELATIGSSQIDVKLNNSVLNTRAISKGAATGGSRHIELLNSSIEDFETGLTFGDGIWLSLGSVMDGEYDYAQNLIRANAVFQPGSFLDAWGNLSFSGSASFGGQLDLHAFPSEYHGRSKITVQGPSFNYGAGSSAGDFASMNVYGNNFNQPTCPPPQCAAEGLITLQLSNGNYNGLASIGGPLFIYNTDGSIPAEGNLYTLISLDPNYQGAFDPNNNKFTSIRWVGQPLPNGLTFEQVLTQNALQLLCKRAAIVEPAPSNTTNLANIPIAAASADFTSDGRDDVVNLIVGSSNSVQIMKDFGDGTFTQLRTFALPIAEIPNAIAAGNVQDSSMPEIAVTSTVSGVGFVTLYNATGTVIWRRQLDNSERPTCVCTLSPNIANNVPGKVAVGIEKTSAFTTESSFATTSGSLKTMTATTTTDTPLAGVPRTVRGTDVNGDDFDDATTTGEPSTTTALSPTTGGFIQPVTMTANGPQSQSPQWLNYVPVSIAIGDIDHDGVKDIFAACKDIPAAVPASTRPVACFLSGSISPSSGLYTMSSPTGISVGRPVQGKAITLVQRSDGYSLAVASTDGVNDSVDVLEINTFANGGITVGAQTQIATGGGVISLLTLLDTSRQKFATVRNVVSGFASKDARSSKIASMRGESGFTTNAVIESTGYLEFAYGDINHDGQIDSADLGDMLSQFGLPGNSDLNGDGNTDSADLGVWLGLL